MLVQVGVSVIIIDSGFILLGKRNGSHGKGTWAPPGGHLHYQETPEDCAKREVLEETGMHVNNLRRLVYTNDLFPESKKHYVTLFVLAKHSGETPRILEPEKCEVWKWFSLNKLPTPLFIPFANFLSSYDELSKLSI